MLSNFQTSEQILWQQASSIFQEGIKLLSRCCYQEALAKFDEAMYLAPKLKGLQVRRAHCLLNVGRVSEAEIAANADLKLQSGLYEYSMALLTNLPQAYGLEKILAVPTHMTFSERMLLKKLSEQIVPGGVIVEIGSYVGASSCFLAEGGSKQSAHLFCIDTWQNEGMSEGPRDTFKDFQQNTRAYQTMITPLRGKSIQVVTGFSQQIDLLFIDGDHSYKGCREDIEAWLPKMKDGGIVIFHDYGWNEEIQTAVAELMTPVQSEAGKCVDSIYWTRVRAIRNDSHVRSGKASKLVKLSH